MIRLEILPTIYTPYLHQIFDASSYGAPRGTFYQITRDTIPYQPRPTSLILHTTRVGELHKLYIEREELPRAPVDSRDVEDEYDIIPASESFAVNIVLGLGLNKIQVETVGDSREEFQLNIVVNDIHTIWVSFLRDYYTNVIRKVNDQKNAISSLYATRLVEPFLSIQDLLPQIESLRTMTTKLALRGVLHSPGTNDGTTDLIKALTLGTPVYNEMDKRTFELDPAADPWTNLSSQFYGTEAHCWIPNQGITRYAALIKYISANPSNFSLVDINEQQIRFYYQGKLRSHLLDLDRFGADYFQQLARTECFNNIRVSIIMQSHMNFRFAAASYTFDLVLEKPIGNARISWDQDIPFDQNLPFDSDAVDPFSDGWLGISLSGRFEQLENQQLALDSFVAHTPTNYSESFPYQSWYTRSLNNVRADAEMVVSINVSGEII